MSISKTYNTFLNLFQHPKDLFMSQMLQSGIENSIFQYVFIPNIGVSCFENVI